MKYLALGRKFHDRPPYSQVCKEFDANCCVREVV